VGGVKGVLLKRPKSLKGCGALKKIMADVDGAALENTKKV
jgi:hypothetical protein